MSAVTTPPWSVPSNPLCCGSPVKRASARSRETSKSRCSPCGLRRPHAKHQCSKSMISDRRATNCPARSASNVELRFGGVGHDPLLAAFDLVAHELVKDEVGPLGILERHATQRARRGIDRRV